MPHGYGPFNERVGYQNIDPTGVKTRGDGMPFLQVPAANGSNTTLDLAVAATSGITGDLALNYSSVRITAGTIATGNCTHTLGDGQWVGQVWELRCDGSMITSNIVVTITNVIGGQSVFVLNRAGDGLLVRWNGNAWQVLSGQSAFIGGDAKVLVIDPDDNDMDNTTLDLAIAATSGITGDAAVNYDRIEIAAGDIATGDCTQTIGAGLYDGQILEIRLTGRITTQNLVVTVTNIVGGQGVFVLNQIYDGMLIRWNGVTWQSLLPTNAFGTLKVLAIDPDDDDMDNTTLDLAIAATSTITGDVALNYDRIEVAAGDIAVGNCTQTIGAGLYDGQVFEIRLAGAITTSILVVTVTNTIGGQTVFNMDSANDGLLMRWNGVAWQILAGNPTQLGANVDVAGDALVIPVTHRFVSKTTAGDAEALSLAAGTFDGQLLTISLVTDGGGDGTLTPALATGWATAVFVTAKDTLTLQWVDPTIGWIVIGVTGTAAATYMVIT